MQNSISLSSLVCRYFFSYLGVCSQLPNLLLNFMNLFIVSKANLPLRIRASLGVVALVCIFTMVFIAVDTTKCKFAVSNFVLKHAQFCLQGCLDSFY